MTMGTLAQQGVKFNPLCSRSHKEHETLFLGARQMCFYGSYWVGGTWSSTTFPKTSSTCLSRLESFSHLKILISCSLTWCCWNQRKDEVQSGRVGTPSDLLCVGRLTYSRTSDKLLKDSVIFKGLAPPNYYWDGSSLVYRRILSKKKKMCYLLLFIRGVVLNIARAIIYIKFNVRKVVHHT